MKITGSLEYKKYTSCARKKKAWSTMFFAYECLAQSTFTSGTRGTETGLEKMYSVHGFSCDLCEASRPVGEHHNGIVD